jgi:hypothetical protein
MSAPYRSILALLTLPVLSCGGGVGPADVAPPAALALTTMPPSARNRVPFDPQPVVQLREANGAAMAQAGTVITASITGGGGALEGSTTATTGNTGAASFTDLSLAGTVGERTLTFSAPSLTSATAILTLAAGPAARMAAVAGNNQFSAVGTAVATLPAVRLTDVDANGVSGVAVTFAVDSGNGLITGAAQITDAAGVATVGSWVLGSTPGSNSLIATADGLTGVLVTFKASGITIDPCRSTSSSAITLEIDVTGALQAQDCVFHGGQFHDFYHFTLANQRAVLLSLAAPGFDPIVDLFTFMDQRDRGLRSDTVDARRNAKLKAILPPGSYETAASSFLVGATGPYTLRISATTESAESCELLFVVRGVTTAQQLFPTDCLDDGERFYGDIFDLRLDAGERVTLTQSSTEFVPLLLLYRGSGDLIAEAGGSMTGNAVIDFEADATGSYYFVATSALILGSGAYTLSVSDPSGAPASIAARASALIPNSRKKVAHLEGGTADPHPQSWRH